MYKLHLDADALLCPPPVLLARDGLQVLRSRVLAAALHTETIN